VSAPRAATIAAMLVLSTLGLPVHASLSSGQAPADVPADASGLGPGTTHPPTADALEAVPDINTPDAPASAGQPGRYDGHVPGLTGSDAVRAEDDPQPPRYKAPGLIDRPLQTEAQLLAALGLQQERARLLERKRAEHGWRQGRLRAFANRFRRLRDPMSRFWRYEMRGEDGTWQEVWRGQAPSPAFRDTPDRPLRRHAYRYDRQLPGLKRRWLEPRLREDELLQMQENGDSAGASDLPGSRAFEYDGPWPWEHGSATDGDARKPEPTEL